MQVRGWEANFLVEISHDKLSAQVQALDIDEDLKCTVEDLEQILRNHGVIYGILPNVLAQIVENPAAFLMKYVEVAQGNPAVNGEDGKIIMAFDMHDERRPLETVDGKVDYKEIIQLRNVKRGQLIAERLPATSGHDGMAVTGEPLPSKHGKEARIKVGKNAVLNPDKTALYAAIDGMVSETENDKINVFPVYEVNGDIDYTTGNIDFVGTVVIRGNILNGFKVRAAGDIRIVGGVEGAELHADGSIDITGGIMAGNKGFVRAGTNVRSSFIQEANVEAGEDIIVSQSIMHSKVRAGHNVLCKDAKGLIVGGNIVAGERIVARTIGNTMSTVTALEVGVKPQLRNELQELKILMRQLREGLDKTEKALTLLDHLAAAGQLTPEKMDMRIKFSATKKQTLLELDEGKERMLEIEKTLEDTDNSRVDVLNTIYGGSKVVIGRYTRFIKEPIKGISFRYAEGDVVTASLHGS